MDGPDAREQLEHALDAHADETDYFIRQALQFLESPDEGMVVERPSSEGGDLAVWLPVNRPLYDRVELEASERDMDVEEWMLTQLWIALERLDHREYEFTVAPEVDLPEAVARRARLKYEYFQSEGKDTSLDEVLMGFVQFRPTYTVDGEPIEE